MRNIMYLRPGNLYKDFFVEESVASVNAAGRTVQGYSTAAQATLKGCLAEAEDKEVSRYGQIGHPVTHTIVQKGRRLAKPDDRLHMGDRTFLVRGVEEPGNLGICTIYYVEERTDVK